MLPKNSKEEKQKDCPLPKSARPAPAVATVHKRAIASPEIIIDTSKSAAINQRVEIPDVIFDSKQMISYQRGKLLGKGGFAKCFEAVDPKTKQILACKIVFKGLLTKTHHREKMAQEISIHRDVKHAHIVEFHSYFEDDNHVYVMLELCAKKSLMELQKRRRVITEPEARYFLRQLALAVLYLHEEKQVIHRDLKLGNIFINDNMELKIGDFGLATYVNFGERKLTMCGTPNYIAPEVLNKRGHSFEVDIWSIGCILYTLLVGRPPFETNSLRDTYAKIRRADYHFPKSRLSSACRNLITQMLQVDPSGRPSCKQILSHEFLSRSFIPTSLPASALTAAPRFEVPKLPQMSKEPNSNDAKRPLVELNAQNLPSKGVRASLSSSSPVMGLPKASVKQSGVLLFENSVDLGYEEVTNKDMMELMQSMAQQISTALAGKRIPKSVSPVDDESEDPSLCPMLWVAKWVDYSDKYGFGYQLSDDSIGVSFNDQTKLVLLSDMFNMHYIDRAGKEQYYSTETYPTEIQKKVKLMKYFQQYMKENLLKTGSKLPVNNACIARLPNLWTWFRTSRSVVMILNNGSVQINNFRDHHKMILCPLLGAVSTITDDRTMRTFKLSSLNENGISEGLASRLEYALEKCTIVNDSLRSATKPPPHALNSEDK